MPAISLASVSKMGEMGRSSCTFSPPSRIRSPTVQLDGGVGDLVDHDQDQIVGDELAAAHAADRAFARGRGPDEEVDQRRDHPAEGQQEEETAPLKP